MLLYIYITVLYGDVEEVKPPAPLASMSKCKLLKLTAVSVCEVGKKHYINIIYTRQEPTTAQQKPEHSLERRV